MKSTVTEFTLMGCGNWYITKTEVEFINLRIREKIIFDLDVLNHLTRQERKRMNIVPCRINIATNPIHGLIRIINNNSIIFRTLHHLLKADMSINNQRIKLCNERFNTTLLEIEILDIRDL
jgi:hypothetical protein